MSNLVEKPTAPIELLKEMMNLIPCTSHIKLHACYHVVVNRHWGFENRINQDFHMILIKSGNGCYQVGDTVIPFSKGQIIVVSPGMRHTAEQDKENPPAIIPVRFGLYDNYSRQPNPLTVPPFFVACIPNDIMKFQQLFEELHLHSRMTTGYHDLVCGTLITQILLKLCMEVAADDHRIKWDTRVEKVKNQIDKNPQLRQNSVELAEAVELSEKYFREIFKRQYGLTPLEYQVKARMEYARFLIAESGQSIKQAALTLGYPDPYTFSKQFKQIMGYPPLQLKRKT